MGEVIYRPEPKHVCKPFMDKVTVRGTAPNAGTAIYDQTPPVGTIWRCDCGRLWEVVPAVGPGAVGTRRWQEARLLTSLRVWYRLRNSTTGKDD